MKKLLKGIILSLTMVSMVCGVAVLPEMPAEAASSVKVYRLNNPKSGEYLYTTDNNEVNVLTSKMGWKSEGVAWNAPTSGTPIYRLNNPKGFHLFTQDQNEIRVLTTQMGWTVDNDNKPMFYSGGNTNVYRAYHGKTGRHLLTANKSEYDALVKSGWTGENVSVKAESAPAASQVVAPTPAPAPAPTPSVTPSTGNSNASVSAPTQSSAAVGSDVWVPKTGKKYHSTSTCSNMNNPSKIKYEDAVKRGYTKCSKCW